MAKETITKSYSRKLNMSMHGGKQFETMDISESRTISIDGMDGNVVDEVAARLFEQVKASVERDIVKFDAEMGAEETDEEPKQKKVKADEKVVAEAKSIKGSEHLINAINRSKTKDELTAVGKQIKEAIEQKKLTAEQVTTLSKLYEGRKKHFKSLSK